MQKKRFNRRSAFISAAEGLYLLGGMFVIRLVCEETKLGVLVLAALGLKWYLGGTKK